MPTNLKELLVILTLAAVIFRVVKPLALQFSHSSDFARRRNVWIFLTVVAFTSPNFWIYALFAIPLFFWGSRQDSNPIAFFLLMLFIIPPVDVSLPTIGINELFPMSNFRLLSFCVLIPTALKLRSNSQSSKFTLIDLLCLGFGAIQIAIFIPPDLPGYLAYHDSFTNVLRRAVLFAIDQFVLYYAVSRFCTSRRSITEAQAALCVSCAIMALIAIFEYLRHWLVYAEIAWSWNDRSPSWGFYIPRAGVIRAQAAAGHPLILGYVLSIGFGFWLYLRSLTLTNKPGIIVSVLFWLGLLATYSRGPWIGAAVIYFAYVAITPRAISNLMKSIVTTAILLGVISMTPLGDRIVNVLPFLGGQVDASNIDYRERLAERSWELIVAHPLFGDQYAFLKMQDLRQGQGIIDVVNSYAQIALNYGLVGLTFFALLILVPIVRCYRISRTVVPDDLNLANLGASLVACALGGLLMIAAISFGLGVQTIFFVLVGLSAAYAQCADTWRQSPAPPNVLQTL